MFEETLPTSDLVNAFEKLRVPRHLFKFLYRLITDHCHAHGSDFPSFQIGAATFQATLAVYLRDLRSLDAGIAVGLLAPRQEPSPFLVPLQPLLSLQRQLGLGRSEVDGAEVEG
jgi:hypothetical protein